MKHQTLWATMTALAMAMIPWPVHAETAPLVPWELAGDSRWIPNPQFYAQTAETVSSPQSIHFDMQDAHYYQIPLNRQPVSISVSPGQTVAIREVAENVRQDTALVKIGIPSSTSLSEVAAAPILQLAYRVPAPAGGDPRVSGAYTETGWNDFLGITVGIVWNFISFSYNGRRVTTYHTWDAVKHPFPDGDYFMSSRQGHGETRGNASGWTFAVEDAPAFANTKIYWRVNKITAHGNGRVTGTVHTWASGADRYLLGGWWQIVHG
jgi:hypothetical protein